MSPQMQVGSAGGRWIACAEAPFLPARDGGQREHLGLARAASAAGVLLALVVFGVRSDDQRLYRREFPTTDLYFCPRASGLGSKVGLAPFVVMSRAISGQLIARIRNDVPDATAVVACSYKVHRAALQLARSLSLPAIMRAHNVEGEYFRSMARSTRGVRKWGVHLEASRVTLDERRMERSGRFAAIIDISRVDAKQRRVRCRSAVVTVPPFAVGHGEFATVERRPIPDTVLFVGALDVKVSLRGLRWMTDEVWPRVVEQRPSARLVVVGRHPDARLRARLNEIPGAELHADVSELASFYATAAVAVNPAVMGSGVNIKLVEYAAAGLPVVSTERPCEALGLEHGQHVRRSDDAAVFADEVVALLGSPDHAEHMGRRATQRLSALVDPAEGIRTMQQQLVQDRREEVARRG